MIDAPKKVEPLSFKEHYDRLEAFVDECNLLLRNRGFRLCEACVLANWSGQAILTRSEMTDRRYPNGTPVIAQNRAFLMLPWTTNDSEVDAEMILNYTLGEIEKSCAGQCARVKAVRISFNSYARQMKPAPETTENGRPLIVAP